MPPWRGEGVKITVPKNGKDPAHSAFIFSRLLFSVASVRSVLIPFFPFFFSPSPWRFLFSTDGTCNRRRAGYIGISACERSCSWKL